MRWWSVAVIVLLASSAAVQAQNVRQEYTVREKNKLWFYNKAGGYYENFYVARDANGKVLRKDRVVYFPNAPREGDKGKNNHWVYWYNVDKETIWGRCPTPKHPMYQQWRQNKGQDLWQLIPPEKRQPKVLQIAQVADNFGPTIGEKAEDEKKKLPKVGNVIIDCVDFGNVTFQ